MQRFSSATFDGGDAGWSRIGRQAKVAQELARHSHISLTMNVYSGRDFTRTIPFDKLSALMTKAEVDQARAAGLLTGEWALGFALLTEGPKVTAQPAEKPADTFEAMRDTLKAGVQVVAAPQLFPTPPELAERVVELAGIRPGHDVLEPSAGTGALLVKSFHLNGFGWNGNPPSGRTVAVEINATLADKLRAEFPLTDVRCADFLECNGDLGTFDRIVMNPMNPPFADGQDIKHIEHARALLKPGGRLVAICANGPRQREKPLRPQPSSSRCDRATGGKPRDRALEGN